jgi:hypothetical protein
MHHDLNQSASSVAIDDITIRSTLSVIQPTSNTKHNEVNNRAKYRYLKDVDYQALQQLKSRAMSLTNYEGNYGVDDLVEYFHGTLEDATMEFNTNERSALRQMGKYYDDLMQHCIEQNILGVVEMSRKRNVITSVLKLEGHQGDISSQSSTGLSSQFKKQKLEPTYNVKGDCGAVLLKHAILADARAFVKAMKECDFCGGGLHMETVSMTFFMTDYMQPH